MSKITLLKECMRMIDPRQELHLLATRAHVKMLMESLIHQSRAMKVYKTMVKELKSENEQLLKRVTTLEAERAQK